MPVAGLKQEKCFIIFVDDFSKLTEPFRLRGRIVASLTDWRKRRLTWKGSTSISLKEEEGETNSETDESSSEEEDTITEGDASEQTVPTQIETEPATAAEQQQQSTEAVALPLRRKWGDYSEGELDMNLPIKNLIGSLQFIASRTRPDIAASLNYLSRQTSKPTQSCSMPASTY
ncbi:hypothetical protein TYRP_007972 [Tyrophagus putrescentiae]|nr:hypothetical protein TYRP_007972 [Tyrophagus putrescentiae]